MTGCSKPLDLEKKRIFLGAANAAVAIKKDTTRHVMHGPARLSILQDYPNDISHVKQNRESQPNFRQHFRDTRDGGVGQCLREPEIVASDAAFQTITSRPEVEARVSASRKARE